MYLFYSQTFISSYYDSDMYSKNIDHNSVMSKVLSECILQLGKSNPLTRISLAPGYLSRLRKSSHCTKSIDSPSPPMTLFSVQNHLIVFENFVPLNHLSRVYLCGNKEASGCHFLVGLDNLIITILIVQLFLGRYHTIPNTDTTRGCGGFRLIRS